MEPVDDDGTRGTARLDRLVATVLDELPDTSVIVFDTDLRFVLTRGGAVTGNRMDPADLEGRLAWEALPQGRWEWYEPLYRGALRGESATLDVASPDGSRQYIVRVGPLRDHAGAIVGGVSVATDVTEKHRALQSLAESEAQFRLAMDSAGIGMVLTAPDGRFLRVNPAICRLLGYSADELMRLSFTDVTHPDDLASGVAAARDIAAGRRDSFAQRKRYLAKDGRIVWVDLVVAAVREDDGRLRHFIGQLVDVSAEQRAREDLARSERLFRTAMEFAPTGMAVVDLDRRFRQVNPALCALLGREEGWLLQHGIPDLLDPSGDEVDTQTRAALLRGERRSITAEKVLHRGDGGTVWVEHAIALLRDEEGQPIGFVSQFIDITAAHAVREQLHYQATHDPLTRLANRAELLSLMGRVLRRTPRTDDGTAVLFVDLDGLKSINDSLGHSAGDAVLIEVAERISARVRADDVVARLGGDEYVVLLPTVRTVADAVRIADGIREAVARPILLDGQAARVTASIGAALAEPGDTASMLIERADRALYRAKRAGRDRTAVFDAVLDG